MSRLAVWLGAWWPCAVVLVPATVCLAAPLIRWGVANAA